MTRYPLTAAILAIFVIPSIGQAQTLGGGAGSGNERRAQEEAMRKVREKRKEIEGSSEFSEYWGGGESWHQEILSGMKTAQLDETVPEPPSSEGQDAEIAALIEKLASKKAAMRVGPRKQIRKYGASATIPLVKALASKEYRKPCGR